MISHARRTPEGVVPTVSRGERKRNGTSNQPRERPRIEAERQNERCKNCLPLSLFLVDHCVAKWARKSVRARRRQCMVTVLSEGIVKVAFRPEIVSK